MGLLLDPAGPVVGFPFVALAHHLLVPRDRLHVYMVWQSFQAGDHPPQKPVEPDAYGATHAAQRQTFEQQTLNQSPGVVRDEVLLEAVDHLSSTIVTEMILVAVMPVTILLIGGGHAARTARSDDHTDGELPALSQRFEQP